MGCWPVHCRVTPSSKFTGTHLVVRGTVRLKSLALHEEHKGVAPARAPTKTTWSGVQRTIPLGHCTSTFALFVRYTYYLQAIKINDGLGFVTEVYINRQVLTSDKIMNYALGNKRHAMHAEAMTFHKGSLIIFRTFVKTLG